VQVNKTFIFFSSFKLLDFSQFRLTTCIYQTLFNASNTVVHFCILPLPYWIPCRSDSKSMNPLVKKTCDKLIWFWDILFICMRTDSINMTTIDVKDSNITAAKTIHYQLSRLLIHWGKKIGLQYYKQLSVIISVFTCLSYISSVINDFWIPVMKSGMRSLSHPLYQHLYLTPYLTYDVALLYYVIMTFFNPTLQC
jgi:hypothetical protein